MNFVFRSSCIASSVTVPSGPVATPPGLPALFTQDVEPAQALDGDVNHALDRLSVGDVGDDGQDAAARLLGQLPGGGLQLLAGAGADRHVGALHGQLAGDSLADPLAPSRDQRDFAFELQVHGCLPARVL